MTSKGTNPAPGLYERTSNSSRSTGSSPAILLGPASRGVMMMGLSSRVNESPEPVAKIPTRLASDKANLKTLPHSHVATGPPAGSRAWSSIASQRPVARRAEVKAWAKPLPGGSPGTSNSSCHPGLQFSIIQSVSGLSAVFVRCSPGRLADCAMKGKTFGKVRRRKAAWRSELPPVPTPSTVAVHCARVSCGSAGCKLTGWPR